jgi:hypothetical protein
MTTKTDAGVASDVRTSADVGEQPYQYAVVERAFKGNQDAIDFFLGLCRAFDALDDLEDGDPVTKAEVRHAFWTILFAHPENPFYQRWGHYLRPVMASCFLAWEDSNVLAKWEDPEAKMTAHIKRYDVADLAVNIAMLIGGKEWANEVGPELRMALREGSFDDFVKETS